MKGATIGGAGRVVEVDGCHVGGHVRPENEKKDRQDRRLAENQTGTRRVVVALRERGGRTLTMVFKTEAASIDFIRSRVDRATTIHADEAADWNALAKAGSIPSGSTTRPLSAWTALAPTRRKACSAACAVPRSATLAVLRHGKSFSLLHQFCQTLSFSPPFGSMHDHHLSGAYLDRYARETAFREDHRPASNGEQFHTVVGLVAKNHPSVDFCGYWQRARAA